MITNCLNIKLRITVSMVLFLFGLVLNAQSITGPTTVQANTSATYTYDSGVLYRKPTWNVGGGVVTSSSSSGTEYSVTVLWNSGFATGNMTFLNGTTTISNLSVSIISAPPQGVGTPFINSVRTTVTREATTNVSSLSNSQKIESVAYIDGLGRPIQQVAIRAGANNQDIISHIDYDSYGRQVKEYLPYSSSSNIGTYRPSAQDDTHSFYDTSKYNEDFPGMTISNINPYSEKQFDNSPLNRIEKQAAPGYDWRMGGGHEIQIVYDYNANYEVRKYKVNLSKSVSGSSITYNPSLASDGYYAVNQLTKTITKDENWTSGNNHTTQEFKDKQGRVVLKRTYNNNSSHDTFYVYDDFGNLSYVIPPKAEGQGSVSSTELSELCYQYKYDDRNRLVEKKIPGKDWEYIVYNRLDQPVLTQDGNMRAFSTDRWLFTKYDTFGRVAYTGMSQSNSTRSSIQSAVNGLGTMHVSKQSTSTTIDGTNIFYNNGAYPTSGIVDILSINYYDNYTFDKVNGNSESSYGVTPTTNAKGLATGSKVRILGTNDWITTVTYYDDKSRPIYVYSHNSYLNTTDKVKTKYGFDGRVLETTTTHARTGKSTITIVDYFEYDHMNRMTRHRQSVNGGSQEVIAQNTYDDLGQLVEKGVGGKTNQSRLQIVNYDYNIRGWLKQINNPSSLGSDLFAFKINYNTEDHNGTELFNGNISETEWRTKNDNVLRWYRYNYDDLNRITSAIASSSNYNLSLVNYDKNGNITALNRAGHVNSAGTSFGSNMDILTYGYYTSSNRLKWVNDSGHEPHGFLELSNSSTEYIYDSNGNMTSDSNKGISSISYNHLNLPTSVSINGSEGNGTISYIYDATGVKIKKTVSTGGNTDYAGNFIYESGNLKFFSHPEGYVEPDGSGFDYVYQYKDHLGNIRLTYGDNNHNGSIVTSEIIEENNYYPFGLKHKGYNDVVSANSNSAAKKFMFGGKEYQEELGLDWYDVSARNYDPALGRWMNLDPLAEKMRRHSPYNFAFDNPVYFQDYDGMSPSGTNCCGNPFGGWGDGIARSMQSSITNFSNAVGEKWNNMTTSVRNFLKPKNGAMISNDTGGSSGDQGMIRKAERGQEGIPWVEAEEAVDMLKGSTKRLKGPDAKNYAKSLKNGMKDFSTNFDTKSSSSGESTGEGTMNTETVSGEDKVDISIPVGTLNYPIKGFIGSTSVTADATVQISEKDTTVYSKDRQKVNQQAKSKIEALNKKRDELNSNN
jgi:RHS repeat-associated protein